VARDFAVDDDATSDFLRKNNHTVVMQDVIALNLLEKVIAAQPANKREHSVRIDVGALAARRLLARLTSEPAR